VSVHNRPALRSVFGGAGKGEPVSVIEITMLVYGGLMLVFFVVFLIGFFRYRKRVRPYVKYALVPAVGLILIDAAILFVARDALEAIGVPQLCCMGLVAFVRVIVFGAVGMYCAASVGSPHAPLLRATITRRRHLARGLSRGLLLWVPALVAAAIAYSCALFTLVPVRMSEDVREMLESSAISSPISAEPSLLAALVMLEFALGEEVAFRLGVQNYIAKLFKLRGNGYWIAIVFTAVFWSVAHINMLEPGWAKVLQVFPLGLALGLLSRRYGIEACILAHGLFNLIMMFLAPSLIEI